MANIIDRRQTKDKNSENKKRYLDHHERLVREAIERELLKKNIGDKLDDEKLGIADTEQQITVGIDRENIKQIFCGNQKYRRGDRIKRQEGKGSGGGRGDEASPFSITVTKEELDHLLFDNCELPEWIQKANPLIKDYTLKHAGFKKSGLPSNLDVLRSVKNGLSRQMMLVAAYEAEIEEQQKVVDNAATEEEKLKAISDLKDLIEQKDSIPFLDDIDLRFRYRELIPNYTSKGVIFFMMDVSGSVDQSMRDTSKLFFMLVTMFLQKHYESIDIVFIKHADSAVVCKDEKEFYAETLSGGTVFSSGLVKIKELIENKYHASEYNIYIMQSSDGGLFSYDETLYVQLLEDLLPKVQMYVYTNLTDECDIAELLSRLAKNFTNFYAYTMSDRSDVIPVFYRIFSRE